MVSINIEYDDLLQIVAYYKEKYMYDETMNEPLTFVDQAIQAVYLYVKKHLEKTDTHVTFGRDEVYVVWFSKTLKNWKALVSTTLPDGMYYEVTYNGEAQELYLDAYKKFDNVRYTVIDLIAQRPV